MLDVRVGPPGSEGAALSVTSLNRIDRPILERLGASYAVAGASMQARFDRDYVLLDP